MNNIDTYSEIIKYRNLMLKRTDILDKEKIIHKFIEQITSLDITKNQLLLKNKTIRAIVMYKEYWLVPWEIYKDI